MPRMSADERREVVLRSAVIEFGRRGLDGTSTESIARRAGISQPYLFRLFPTKKDLFIAAHQRCMRRIRSSFEEAAGGLTGQEAFMAMGEAYMQLLADRELLLMQLQTYAACDDPDVRESARRGFGELWTTVERLSGLPDEDLVQFFATGMLLNTGAAMGLSELDDRWARLATKRPCD